MRLNALHLIRYGNFEDAEIVFPVPARDTPDVSVVYGPNEAGKSTAFHALLEIFFGFRAGAHPYAFRFERSDLLVGADLDLPDRGATVLRRNSKGSQSLLDTDNRPIADTILGSALHGLTRDEFEERFSLDERGLRDGGERIASAKGDLGQLLHAGVSGLTGISETLNTLSERADKFHKKHGRATELKLASDRLKKIGRELRADRLTSERERTLRQDRDQKTALFDAENTALVTAQKRRLASTAASTWFDRTEEMERLAETLKNYPSGPDLPRDAAERVAALVEKISSLEARISEADDDVAGLDQIIEGNPADTLAPALSAELERLDQMKVDGAPLMDRATTAHADLDRRTADRDALATEISTTQAQLSVSGTAVSDLVLDTAELEEITEVVEACRMASEALNTAKAVADAARAREGEAPSQPQDLTLLREAFETWRPVLDLTTFETEREQTLARLTKAAADLPADWTSLVDAGLPAPETLEKAAREWSDLSSDSAAAKSNVEERTKELEDATADLSALQAAPEAVDVATTEETRRHRDLAWTRHRDDLSDPSADQFEAAMRADDSARAHFVAGAEIRQRRLEAQRREKTAKARLETAEARLADLIDRRASLSEVNSRLSVRLGLEAGATPAAFGPRHQALAAAANAAADHSNAQAALDTRRHREEALRTELMEAARALDLGVGKGGMAARVQRVLTLEESDRKAWSKWKESQKAIDKLDDDALVKKDDLKRAELEFERLTSSLPLPDRSVEGVRTALPQLRNLIRLHTDHQRLDERIEALQQAILALSEGAERLAKVLGATEDQGGQEPIQIIDQARLRLAAAARADEKRGDAELRRDKVTAARYRHKTDLETARNELDDRFKGQGDDNLAPSDRIARLVERDRLRAEQLTADRNRQQAIVGVDKDLFNEELDRMPDASRGLVLEQQVQDAQDSRDAARDAAREAERLYLEAFDAADRSVLVTEQATLLEALRSGGRNAVVARLGVLAARGALRRLAEERRSDMLRDVEAAFVTMTKPKWRGVDVWSQVEGEKLVGIDADGDKVPVDKMSTGTMGQLYFALRLAGYRSFARDLGPLPMILDDIMETFDDTRARAALQLCAEIGSSGQAILFTHHAHLVEMAQTAVPGVAIVEMPT
ncbi:MAG: AAA family ATPase [Pseudomonadota bacterium]